jgi:hypothetical protein
VASGANVKAVQRMRGHASAAMTLDVYSGLFDDDLGGLAERMDAAHDAHSSARTVGHGVGTESYQQDLRRTHGRLSCRYVVGRVGLEPTTQGL